MKNVIVILFSIILFSAGVTQAQVVINPCAKATDIHVVVIGSSTAAGTGPSNSSNAWVNRYRDYLQSINPNNMVTNLAVGGTRTYHIMPDWFVSPANRPSPNPAKNVTQAISLGADAIIVNMPSNDGASGYSTNEQMFNFHTIANVADSAGVAVWICTTQPRNGLSAGQMNVQTEVRDSIIAAFGPRAIDFWNPFASVGNTILTQWDSGDGVHMNDTAHAVLNQKVIDEGIPNEVRDTLTYVDHALGDFFVATPNQCGDSNMKVGVVLINLGIASTTTETLQIQSFDYANSTINNFPLVAITNLGSCVADTNYVTVNSYHGIDQRFDAFLANSNDSDILNDTSASFELLTLGHPNLAGLNDTVLSGANALLTATTGVNDTIVWYDAISGGNILGYGNNYTINNLTADQTVYPEAVRGPLHFAESLFTTANTTTDWNGMMFDIVAQNDIIIDSLRIKVSTTGPETVVAYNRMGSLVGNEMNAAAWTSWGTDVVNAAQAGEFHTIDFSDVTLLANDTLGVYVHMQNGASDLSYLNSAAVTYANSEIAVVNGTGVTHTFGTTYSPRNWSGEVFYHYGFNPQGDCNSRRIPVSGIIKYPSSTSDIALLDLKIVPNPTAGLLRFIGAEIPTKVQVSNMQGQVITSLVVENNQIELENLSTGLYMLSFKMEGVNYTRKIMLR